MLSLELKPDIRNKFKILNGTDDNKEIEQFIKDNIGIKDYSYHQIQTFIKLYKSQFDAFKGKLKFTNSQDEDIIKKYIECYVKNIKYFTNGGFAKLIFEKKYIKDIFELCLDIYKNDLNKTKFNPPLIFIDKDKKKF